MHMGWEIRETVGQKSRRHPWARHLFGKGGFLSQERARARLNASCLSSMYGRYPRDQYRPAARPTNNAGLSTLKADMVGRPLLNKCRTRIKFKDLKSTGNKEIYKYVMENSSFL